MKTSTAAVAAILVLTGCTGQQAASAPQATPKPDPEASATAAASTPASGPMVFEDIEAGTELEPGSYVLNFSSIGGEDAYPTLAVTFTVPESWSRVRLDGVVWHDHARLGFFIVDNLYVDPCNTAKGVIEPPIGPSVDDLTRALLAKPGWEPAVVDEAELYGFGGQRLEVTVPADAPICDAEDSRLMHTLGSPGYTIPPSPGEQIEMRVLNVDGTRLAIAAVALPSAPAKVRAELAAVLDSVQIQP